MHNTELAVCEDVLEIDPPAPCDSRPDCVRHPAHHGAEEPREQIRRAYLCRHIFADGRRCGSPALRAQHFCYYHYAHRTPVLANVRRRQAGSGFELTRLDGLDNHTAIQLAVSEVVGRIASNEIGHKTAWLLLYGLQIADHNLRRSRPAADPLADSIVEDAVHGQLAEPEPGRREVQTQLLSAQDFEP